MKVSILLLAAILICSTSDAQKRSRNNQANQANQVTSQEAVAPELLSSMKYRLIGPFRGGRSTAVAGIIGDSQTYYMGTTGGGVWRTDNAGITWENISDGFFNVGSIGAIELAPSDKNVIYVGTGSACPRGNISAGDGIYVSLDAGETWTHSGLKQSGSISKIVVHPRDPMTVYVAVLGNPFGRNSERGVYKTDNGGESWKNVFFINDGVGAVDLVMHPENTRVLYAGMWRVERKPWTLIDGDENSGLYVSKDEGVSWTRVKGGLPQGIGGRIGVTISPANPNRMWVIQEMQEETESGVFRSDNAGKSWQKVNREHKLRQRAWYYNHIHADPNDENTVYINNTGFYKSIDAGKSFESIRVPHGDNHGMWINPKNSENMIQCNDGGANISFDGGKSWSVQTNQPTSEMYRVTVDNQFPYRVYGAQQDNSTISILSNPPGGLHPKQHWYSVAGGESGHIAVDPDNPSIVYSGNYIGRIDRIDLDIGHQRNVTAYPQMHDGVAPRDIKYRFQWNAPIRISPHDKNVIYHCSQYVHKSMDAGQSWEIISPDLTTNKDEYQNIPGGPIQHDHTGVELYTTIFAFEESTVEAGVLWAGTDDGRIHITRNGGSSWTEITPAGFPHEATINTIDLSNKSAGKALITAYKYRDNDFKPYIYQTTDFGASWRLLTNGSNGIPSNHFTRVAREDPVQEDLIFAGTEFGIYVSFNSGSSWQSLQQNLPKTPITDLAIKGNELVVATQGRSFWILDNLSILRQLAVKKTLNTSLILTPETAYRMQGRGFRGPSSPQSKPRGVGFNYYLNEYAKNDTVKLTIYDGDKVARVLSNYPETKDVKISPRKGMNRTMWNMTLEAPEINPGSYFSLSYTGGPTTHTGEYSVELSVNGASFGKEDFQILKDPRWEWSDDDLMAQYELTMEAFGMLEEAHRYIKTIRDISEQCSAIVLRNEGSKHHKALKEKTDEIKTNLKAIEEELIQTKNESGQDPINYPPKLDDQIAYLYSNTNSQDSRPTEGSYQRRDDLRQELDVLKDRLQGVIDSHVAELEEFLKTNDIPAIVVEVN